MVKKSTKLGFTLIELLVVIAIIGVLASIVLASLNSAREKSRDARRINDVKQIQLALELYFDGAGDNAYPTATATCDTTTYRGLETLSTNNYIPQVPRDPNATVECYFYASGTSPVTVYHLGAVLEDVDHQALDSDSDTDSTSGGLSYTQGFAGLSTDCGGTVETTDNCYDVVP